MNSATLPTGAEIPSQTDECFRCGYDLRGIANDQACPECGLLAERSRRVTDELFETRPRWLRAMAAGVILILLSLLLAFAWMNTFEFVQRTLSWRSTRGWQWTFRLVPLGFLAPCLVFALGIVLLTRREGYPPADGADRTRRILLRFVAFTPVIAVAVAYLQTEIWIRYFYRAVQPYSWLATAAIIIGTLGTIPLPWLLFLQLQSLAKRARSAHLAEHCKIVGIGMSAALVYGFGVYELMEHADKWGFSPLWVERSNIALAINLLIMVACVLFFFWSIYLLVRFAIAFAIASRQRSRVWKRDDRSLTVG